MNFLFLIKVLFAARVPLGKLAGLSGFGFLLHES